MKSRTMVMSGALGAIVVGGVTFALMTQPPAEAGQARIDGAALAAPESTLPVQVASWEPEIGPFDQVLGAADAPVTVIEYASFTCGHCADFHTETLPALKETYIDTGAVRFVFRDFPLDGLALRAGMLARCGRDDQFFGLVDAIFAAQPQWIRDQEPIAALQRLGSLAGIGSEQFEACMTDEALSNQIIQSRIDGQELYDIRGTPSFVIDGEVVSGHLQFDEFAALLDELLPGDLTD